MDLVQRHADETDRRKVHVVAAQDKLDALSATHFEELRAIGRYCAICSRTSMSTNTKSADR